MTLFVNFCCRLAALRNWRYILGICETDVGLTAAWEQTAGSCVTLSNCSYRDDLMSLLTSIPTSIYIHTHTVLLNIPPEKAWVSPLSLCPSLSLLHNNLFSPPLVFPLPYQSFCLSLLSSLLQGSLKYSPWLVSSCEFWYIATWDFFFCMYIWMGGLYKIYKSYSGTGCFKTDIFMYYKLGPLALIGCCISNVGLSLFLYLIYFVFYSLPVRWKE